MWEVLHYIRYHKLGTYFPTTNFYSHYVSRNSHQSETWTTLKKDERRQQVIVTLHGGERSERFADECLSRDRTGGE